MENQAKFRIPQNISGASQFDLKKSRNRKKKKKKTQTGSKQLVQVIYKKSAEAPTSNIDTEDVLNLH